MTPLQLWSPDPHGDSVRLAYPYFEHREPLRFAGEGSYADRKLPTTANVTYEWMYVLSEILMALIGAGPTIKMFNEHRWCLWQALLYCVQQPNGLFYRPDLLRDRIPLLFSLKARKLR